MDRRARTPALLDKEDIKVVMEFGWGTIGPVMFYLPFALGALIILSKIRRAFWRWVGWMVVNGYYFPTIMREARDKNIARIQRENAEFDKIIENRSMRGWS